MNAIYARRVYQGRGKWLDSAIIEFDSAGRITALRPKKSAESPANFTEFDGIVLPGLINAHTHFEYSAMRGKLSGDGTFADWIRAIGPLKDATPRHELAAAADRQIQQLIANGVTAVGDNIALDVTPELLRHVPLTAICFFELIEFLPEKTDAALQRYALREQKFPDAAFGFAPHAPYSVSPQLLQWSYRQSVARGRPLSIHAAETQDEMEFFARGAGPLADLKREYGTLPPDWQAPGISPVQYLGRLGVLGRNVLLAHVTYPQPGDLELIAAEQASIVFCPGTHRYFGRGAYPLTEFLTHGINVCVGTDSLASNAELDLRRELRIAREMFPQLSAEQLLEFITANAARALGLNDRGTIAPGYRADLSVWHVAQPDLECWLHDPGSACIASFADGKQALS